jgi:uncharacterized protein involved in exopolysaccharide biosynthesis
VSTKSKPSKFLTTLIGGLLLSGMLGGAVTAVVASPDVANGVVQAGRSFP